MSSTKKLYYKVGDVQKDLDSIYEKGVVRGVYLGFEGLHDYFTLRPSGTTYVYGSPWAGKSLFWFEMMMNLSELHGQRHVIYSPESGEAHEIYADLISMRARKPFYRNLPLHMKEEEYYRHREWVAEYFYVIDPKDRDLTIEGFYDQVDAIEQEYGLKINTTACDPFNELKHNFESDEGRQDLYIENRLGLIRRDAMTNKRHNTIITHVANQEQVKLKDGTRYYPPASPREIAGGQAWYRKAMNLICVWRPPFGIIDPETGMPYAENETHIIIRKFKPKGVGKTGTVRLYYDGQKNRYYEKRYGQNRYAGVQEQIEAQGRTWEA